MGVFHSFCVVVSSEGCLGVPAIEWPNWLDACVWDARNNGIVSILHMLTPYNYIAAGSRFKLLVVAGSLHVQEIVLAKDRCSFGINPSHRRRAVAAVVSPTLATVHHTPSIHRQSRSALPFCKRTRLSLTIDCCDFFHTESLWCGLRRRSDSPLLIPRVSF